MQVRDLTVIEFIGLHLTDAKHADDLTVGTAHGDSERALDVRLAGVRLRDAAEIFLQIAKLDGLFALSGTASDAFAERNIINLGQQHRLGLRRDSRMGDQGKQSRRWIGPVNCSRDTFEIIQRAGEHVVPIGGADEQGR